MRISQVILQLSLCLLAAPLLGAARLSDGLIGPGRRLLNHTRNESVLEIVIFADSYSDTGRYFALANGTEPPPEWFYNGRYSNGPLWHEYLEAASNGLPYANGNTSFPVQFSNALNGTLSGYTYSPPVAGSKGFKVLNFAVAGSPACQSNRDFLKADSPWPDVPWLAQQIDDYQLMLNQTDPKSPNGTTVTGNATVTGNNLGNSTTPGSNTTTNGTANTVSNTPAVTPGVNASATFTLGSPQQRLCVIETGGNDYLNQFQNISNTGDLDLELGSLPEEVAGCIVTAATRLLQSGEKFIMIFTLPPVDKIPQSQALNIGNLVEKAAKLAARHNVALRQGVASLRGNFTDAHIFLYEMGNALNQAIQNPASFNLTNTEDSCLEYTSTAGEVLGKIPFIGDNIEDSIDKLFSSEITGRCPLTEQYAWFDRIHPTTHLHRLLGEDVAAFMQQNSLMNASGITTARRANTAPPVDPLAPPPATGSAAMTCMGKISMIAPVVAALSAILFVHPYLMA